MEKLLILAFLIPLLSPIPSLSRMVPHGHVNFNLSCDHTPYPQICNSFIKTNELPTSQEASFAFRDIALKVTLDHAQEVHRVISSMDFSSFDERAKMAWEDCLELYEDTVYQLNETILSSNNYPKITGDDIQTYLSAATANHETCKNGFNDFNLSSHLESFPFIVTDFSKLLTNALAINGIISTSSSSTMPIWKRHVGEGDGHGRRLLDHRFPSWLSMADRKLLQSSTLTTGADLVVAKDDSGNYKTITEAITAAEKLRSGTKRFVIYVKAGTYSENVVVTNKMKNLMLIGDGIDVTVVTSNKNAQDAYTTFRSATFAVSGDGFIGRDITFENTAGPEKHQAVALRSGSDFSIFYQCSFKGYQDTLYVYSKRQFYRNCFIYGTVDFIFGDASAVLQSCSILVRTPSPGQRNTVTAQARSDPHENTAIIIHSSSIGPATPGPTAPTFLGRPWKEYSRVVVMRTEIGALVDPAGWAPWSGEFALKTLYYGEYMNTGDGADTAGRVGWPGYHVIKSPDEAEEFTVGRFLGGDSWIPGTGVPFTAGL